MAYAGIVCGDNLLQGGILIEGKEFPMVANAAQERDGGIRTHRGAFLVRVFLGDILWRRVRTMDAVSMIKEKEGRIPLFPQPTDQAPVFRQISGKVDLVGLESPAETIFAAKIWVLDKARGAIPRGSQPLCEERYRGRYCMTLGRAVRTWVPAGEHRRVRGDRPGRLRERPREANPIASDLGQRRTGVPEVAVGAQMIRS